MKLSIMFFIFFTCLSCGSGNDDILLLTDDPFVYDASIIYNSRNPVVKIRAELIEKDGSYFYSKSDKKKTEKYGVFAGTCYPSSVFTPANSHKMDILLESGRYFRFVNDFFEYSQQRGLIYSADIPVLTAKSSDKTEYSFTLDKFKEFINDEVAKNSTNEQLVNRFPFIPQLSALKEIEFLLMNNDLFRKDGKDREFLNKDDLQKGFDYYYNFYGNGVEQSEINRVISRARSGGRKLFLENNLFSFDFNYLSDAVLDKRKKVLLIEENETVSLRQSVISVSRKCSNRKAAELFVTFLLSEEIQNRLLNESFNRRVVYGKLFIPVITENNELLTLGLDNGEKIFSYISGMRYPYMGEYKNQGEFFTMYRTALDMLEKERLSKDEFFNFLNKNLK